MKHKILLDEIEKEKIDIVELNLPKRLKGIYSDNTIALSKHLETNAEIACTLAEELGHYYTTVGDILDQSKVENRKQEKIARAWGYERLIGIIDLVNAYKDGIRNRYELAEYLEVTEEFIGDTLNYYKEKYGLYYRIDNYIVYFEPLVVLEKL